MQLLENSPYVFINCPFDSAYLSFFEHICFTLVCCGYTPRCSLENLDAGRSRLEKLAAIIAQCPLGIHDLTRTDLSGNGLPRFNMPFELGLFMGCRLFGGAGHSQKNTLILVEQPYRYQAFLSDVAGNDPLVYADTGQLVKSIYDWLQSQNKRRLPGPGKIPSAFRTFAGEVPAYCAELGLDRNALSFADLVYLCKHSLHSGPSVLQPPRGR